MLLIGTFRKCQLWTNQYYILWVRFCSYCTTSLVLFCSVLFCSFFSYRTECHVPLQDHRGEGDLKLKAIFVLISKISKLLNHSNWMLCFVQTKKQTNESTE